jgi:hypothetical protein
LFIKYPLHVQRIIADAIEFTSRLDGTSCLVCPGLTEPMQPKPQKGPTDATSICRLLGRPNLIGAKMGAAFVACHQGPR